MKINALNALIVVGAVGAVGLISIHCGPATAWVWGGFHALAVAAGVVCRHLSWMLAAICAGEWLLKLVLMTVILGAWSN